MTTTYTEISFNPTLEQTNEIQSWLTEEETKSGEGFNCQWNSISRRFANNNSIVISYKGKTVGFATWWQSTELTVQLCHVEIKPTHRSRGFGRYLITHLFNYFINNNIYAVKLKCDPESSELIWRKLGFIEFPNNHPEDYSNNGSKNLYQILVSHNDVTNTLTGNEYIELWNFEPYQVTNIKPTWTWKLDFKQKTRKLLKPIISPCDSDWKIKWIQQDRVIRDVKVKYLSNGEFFYDGFLIINEASFIP